MGRTNPINLGSLELRIVGKVFSCSVAVSSFLGKVQLERQVLLELSHEPHQVDGRKDFFDEPDAGAYRKYIAVLENGDAGELDLDRNFLSFLCNGPMNLGERGRSDGVFGEIREAIFIFRSRSRSRSRSRDWTRAKLK